MTSPLFGQATQMLGASLGAGGQTGGLNPLYQIGGPRSAQLALKLMFSTSGSTASPVVKNYDHSDKMSMMTRMNLDPAVRQRMQP